MSTSDVYREIREVFSLVDRDDGGSISEKELGNLLKIIGIEASEEEVAAMIKAVDTDNSGEIEFDGKSFSLLRQSGSIWVNKLCLDIHKL